MISKNVIEEGLAQCIKTIVNCQTHLADYDYTGIDLEYPRVVVDVQMPQFFAIQSRCATETPETEKTGKRVITQQFELDVVITCLGSPNG